MIEQISYEEVTAIANYLKSASSNMRDILDQTQKTMTKLNTDDTWKSNAAASLETQFKQLASKFVNFYTEIDNYSRFLTQTVETYKAADQAIQGKIGQ